MNEPIQQVESTTLLMCAPVSRWKILKMKDKWLSYGKWFHAHNNNKHKNFVYNHVRYAMLSSRSLYLQLWNIPLNSVCHSIQASDCLIAVFIVVILRFYVVCRCLFSFFFVSVLFHLISTDKKLFFTVYLFVYVLGLYSALYL